MPMIANLIIIKNVIAMKRNAKRLIANTISIMTSSFENKTTLSATFLSSGDRCVCDIRSVLIQSDVNI